jgi:hypothetical protein
MAASKRRGGNGVNVERLQIQGVRVLVSPSDEAAARRLLTGADDISS